MSLAEEPFIIMLHGLVGDEHMEFDHPSATGWNVWIRHNTPDEDEPFKSLDAFDADFQSLTAAELYVTALTTVFPDAPIDRY